MTFLFVLLLLSCVLECFCKFAYFLLLQYFNVNSLELTKTLLFIIYIFSTAFIWWKMTHEQIQVLNSLLLNFGEIKFVLSSNVLDVRTKHIPLFDVNCCG